MSRRRRVFHVVAGGFVLIDLLRRLRDILFGVDVPRIDYWLLIVDVLVLLAILYFEGLAEFRHRADIRRRAFIDQKVLGLSALWDKGQRIRAIVPSSVTITEREKVPQWIAEVESWIKETESFLDGSSSRALKSFMCVTDAAKINPWVNDSPAAGFFVRGEAQAVYQRMIVQLGNLRRIIERPEAYF